MCQNQRSLINLRWAWLLLIATHSLWASTPLFAQRTNRLPHRPAGALPENGRFRAASAFQPNSADLEETPAPVPVDIVFAEAEQFDTYDSPEFADDMCFDCGETVNCECGLPADRFYAGFEFTFVKPRFDDNVAVTLLDSDGSTFDSFSDQNFDYDLELSPRVLVGWEHCDGMGWRATWWQFDHNAATITSSPPSNGFGLVETPTFGDISLATGIPTDVLSAASGLNAYTIDLEATKRIQFCGWQVGVGGGIRYAYSDQRYLAQLRDETDTLRGQIDFRHSVEGFGPTISLGAWWPLTSSLDIFCRGRGSLLFGDGESALNAGEDLDLMTPFTTTDTTSRDDLLSIGEIQAGFGWQAVPRRGRFYDPFFSAALEGQIWHGAGNASSEAGSLGFFGFSTGVGFNW